MKKWIIVAGLAGVAALVSGVAPSRESGLSDASAPQQTEQTRKPEEWSHVNAGSYPCCVDASWEKMAAAMAR